MPMRHSLFSKAMPGFPLATALRTPLTAHLAARPAVRMAVRCVAAGDGSLRTALAPLQPSSPAFSTLENSSRKRHNKYTIQERRARTSSRIHAYTPAQ